MSARFSEGFFDDFLNHYDEDDNLIAYQPFAKQRKYADFNQYMFDSYIEGFVKFLNTQESEVFSKVIEPYFNRSMTFDKSKFQSFNISVCSEHGWEISTSEGKFNLKIPYEIIHKYAMKMSLVYTHRMAVCFYVYVIKNILKKKYNFMDYYECKGPWGMVSGGDGYQITLYYK